MKLTYEQLKMVFKRSHELNMQMGLNNAEANVRAAELVWLLAAEHGAVQELIDHCEDDSMYIPYVPAEFQKLMGVI